MSYNYIDDENEQAYLAYKQAMQESENADINNQRQHEEEQNRYMNSFWEGASVSEEPENLYETFCEDTRISLVESAINILFEKCIGKEYFPSEDIQQYRRSLTAQFVKENGAYNLIESFKGKSMLLSELAYEIEEAYKSITEAVDKNDPSTFVTSKEEENFFENIKGDEDVEDLCDIIRTRVANDSKDFQDTNRLMKSEIIATMQSVEDEINNVSLGDEEADNIVKYECAMRGEEAQQAILNRPHGILEEVFSNMCKSIITNTALTEQYTNESGQLDNDAIYEKAVNTYTFLEMVNALRLSIKPINEEYLAKELNLSY